MERQYYKKLWWEIILTILAFSVIPLFVLGAVIYQQFSKSYYTKIMGDMKTLAENRSSSIDLFLEERISQLASLAHTIPLEQLQDEARLEKIFNTIQARSRSFCRSVGHRPGRQPPVLRGAVLRPLEIGKL